MNFLTLFKTSSREHLGSKTKQFDLMNRKNNLLFYFLKYNIGFNLSLQE